MNPDEESEASGWMTSRDLDIWTVFARFICGIVLHVSLSAELKQGLTMMKYAVNHRWKFINYKIAFMSGLMQASMIIFVEFINVMALLTNTQVIGIVMDFLALVIISEFDDFFFNAITNPDVTDIIEDKDKMYKALITIQTTTSIYAKYIMEGNRLKPQPCEQEAYDARKEEATALEKKANAPITSPRSADVRQNDPDNFEEYERIPTHIRVQFSDRTWGNMLLYLLYKVFRIFYTSVWFYFLPFVAMICSYAVPYYACQQPGADCAYD